MNKRTSFLREKLINTAPSICSERAMIVTKAYKEIEKLEGNKDKLGNKDVLSYYTDNVLNSSLEIKRARVFSKLLNEMTIFINDQELIVGNHSTRLRAAPIFPEFAIAWVKSEIDKFDKRSGDRFLISKEDKKNLKSIFNFWKGKTHSEKVLANLDKDVKKCWEMGVFDNANDFYGDGHFIPDYPELLKIGLKGNIEKAKEAISKIDTNDPEYFEKVNFLKAVIISNKAVMNFAKRFSKLAKNKASNCQSNKRKNELLRISEICENVPENPPRDFYEALQFIFFIHLTIQLESNGHSISIGRLDQLLYKFYLMDVESGSKDNYFMELLECFFMKVAEPIKLYDWHSTTFNHGHQLFQNLTVGGQDKNGNDASNELTYLILKTTGNLKIIMPSVTVRIHNKTPYEILIASCRALIEHNGGQPSFFNDEAVIPSLMSKGVSVYDALNWSVCGCIEPSIMGKWGGRQGPAFFNLMKILELVINNGKDKITGYKLLPTEKDFFDYKNIGEILNEYDRQIKFYRKLLELSCNTFERMYCETVPVPFASSLIKDCIKRGKEYLRGGAIYNFTTVHGVGFSSTANAISAINEIIFNKGKITLEELKANLDSNYKGDTGSFIKSILSNAPKFGNDDDRADTFAINLMDIYMNNLRSLKNSKGGTYTPSIFTATSNIPFGARCLASPDGRKSSEPLSDGISPAHGTDVNGPIAVLNSLSKLPNFLAAGGALLNQKLDPALVADRKGLDNFASLIKTFFMNKGFHVQFNIVTQETLRDAQKNPSKYKDLMVRVSGWSAYFVQLSKEEQEDIIERTEHGRW